MYKVTNNSSTPFTTYRGFLVWRKTFLGWVIVKRVDSYKEAKRYAESRTNKYLGFDRWE